MVSGSGIPYECCEFSAQFREAVAHAIAEGLAINGLALQSCFGGLHNRAHLLDRFLALLYERLQNLNGLGLVECADLFDFFVLDGRLDSSEDAEAQFVFGAHGVDQVLLDFFGKTHLQLLAPLNIADREIRREGASCSGSSRTYF